MTREALGKRLRFEILKRDGFKCRYCGANSVSVLLQVDHVVPVAEGGNTVPENLVTACTACNAGKSSVPLEESQLAPGSSTDDMLEHAEQIRAYLTAAREVERAKDEITQEVCNYWCERLFVGGVPVSLAYSFPGVVAAIGLTRTFAAIDSVARKMRVTDDSMSSADLTRYFHGVVRSMRKESI